MLKTRNMTFVALSDVLDYMGYTHLQADAADIFTGVTWGDSFATISGLSYILNVLYNYLDSGDAEWVGTKSLLFEKRAAELLADHTFVDMES